MVMTESFALTRHERLSYERAAQAGDGHAAAELAWFYLMRERDQAKGMAWLEKAAELGDVQSQRNLGRMLSGRERETDQAKGLAWLSRAAEEGDALSMMDLGLVLAQHQHTEGRRTEAVTWLEKGLAGSGKRQWKGAEVDPLLLIARREAHAALAGLYLEAPVTTQRLVQACIHATVAARLVPAQAFTKTSAEAVQKGIESRLDSPSLAAARELAEAAIGDEWMEEDDVANKRAPQTKMP
jgi:hypothetical protein